MVRSNAIFGHDSYLNGNREQHKFLLFDLLKHTTMTQEQLKDYKKKLKLYEKLLELWVDVYGEVAVSTGQDGGGLGSNPPPPPPPPPVNPL